MLSSRNGRLAAILLNVVDEDELDGLLLAYSPKFRAILQAGREEIQQTGGIPHDDFWQQVDAAYSDALENEPAHAVNGTAKPKRRRKTVAAQPVAK